MAAAAKPDRARSCVVGANALVPALQSTARLGVWGLLRGLGVWASCQRWSATRTCSDSVAFPCTFQQSAQGSGYIYGINQTQLSTTNKRLFAICQEALKWTSTRQWPSLNGNAEHGHGAPCESQMDVVCSGSSKIANFPDDRFDGRFAQRRSCSSFAWA